MVTNNNYKIDAAVDVLLKYSSRISQIFPKFPKNWKLIILFPIKSLSFHESTRLYHSYNLRKRSSANDPKQLGKLHRRRRTFSLLYDKTTLTLPNVQIIILCFLLWKNCPQLSIIRVFRFHGEPFSLYRTKYPCPLVKPKDISREEWPFVYRGRNACL